MLRAAGRRILGFGLGRRARVSAAAERGPIACDPRERERRDERMLRAAGRQILGFGLGRRARVSAAAVRGFHETVVDYFENSGNVGSFDKNDPSVGTALMGALNDGIKLQIKVDDATGKIVDVFSSFNIATVSMVIEWVKGKHVDEVLYLPYREVAKSLNIDLERVFSFSLLLHLIELAAKDYQAKKVRQLLEILEQIELRLLERLQQIIG